ncbi:MAG: RluA family pseudouridine synthase [Fimbriimonadaceae bacterium]
MPLSAEGKERLDRFVARKMPEHSRTRVTQAIKDGMVTVEGEVVTKPGFELKPGQLVAVGDVPEAEPHDLTPADIPLDVRFEDDDLLVVSKPRGMASHPAPGLAPTTLVNALLARSHALSTHAGDWRPGIVHRLDKETTGLMLVAKNDRAHRILAEQIKEKTAVRIYVANVYGRPEHEHTTVNAPIGRDPGIPSLMTVKQGGRDAVTHVRVLQNSQAPELPSQTLVACRLETGRTHQIRVHLSSIGHPVKGDKQYAKKPWSVGALQLHATLLAFDHPRTGERTTVYALPPGDFEMRDQVSREGVEAWP